MNTLDQQGSPVESLSVRPKQHLSFLFMGIGAVFLVGIGVVAGYMLSSSNKKIAPQTFEKTDQTLPQASSTVVPQVSAADVNLQVPTPATSGIFLPEQQPILAAFVSQILPFNQEIQKELVGREIGQIFENGGVYVIHTVPKGHTFSNQYVVNIYAVNKSKVVALETNKHDVTYIEDVFAPEGLESERLVVQIGGGAHVSFLYLLDIINPLRKISFVDPKKYAEKVKELTSFDLINISADGSIYAEKFTFRNGLLESSYSDMMGEWTVVLTTDLSSGQLSKLQIKKGTQVVFDN